jgi:hypothetical protein
MPSAAVVEKLGMSEERLHEESSRVWPVKSIKSDVNTSWLRLPAVELALKLPPVLPIEELNWAPVDAGTSVTAKVPESKFLLKFAPAVWSINENVPE